MSPPLSSPPPSTAIPESRFHLFQCEIWVRHAWRTTLFEPPKTNSLITANYVFSQLRQSMAFDALVPTQQLLLERFAEQVDNLIVYIAKRPLMQKILNVSRIKLDKLGSEKSTVIGGFVTCILLDRLCWAHDIRVPSQFSQKGLGFRV